MTTKGDYAVSDHVHAESWVGNPRLLASEQVAIEQHLLKSNYAFADSHVGTMTFEQTYTLAGKKKVGKKFVFEWVHNMYDPNIAR